MTVKTVFIPTAAMLASLTRVPFIAAHHFEEWEALETDFPARLAKREARHEAQENARIADVQASIDRVRTYGRTEVFGHPTGYAYKVGQASRRAGNRS